MTSARSSAAGTTAQARPARSDYMWVSKADRTFGGSTLWWSEALPALSLPNGTSSFPIKIPQWLGVRRSSEPRATKGGMLAQISATFIQARPATSVINGLVIGPVFQESSTEATPLQLRTMKRFVLALFSGLLFFTSSAAETLPSRPWSYQPVIRPHTPPVANDTSILNSIDAFLAAQRNAHDLLPVQPAPARLLLRRLYLDLIGLPPTREELSRFQQNPQDYERIVEELLQSPHYGERWGRHWMDVWRYSDWFGLGEQLRYSQKHIWHWRDWIIESLNADKGYDRMLLEMLAADELAPTDRDALRATGFLARQYFLFNRTTWLDATVEHTAQAFLGVTMNCAKCHDHKYDPITALDYYRFRAFFEPYQVRLDAWPGEVDLEKNGLPRVFDAHLDAPTYFHLRGDEKAPDTNQVISPGLPAALSFRELEITSIELPLEAHTPGLQRFVLEDHLRVAQAELDAAQAKLDSAQREAARTVAAVSGAGPNGSEPSLEPENLELRVAREVHATAQLRPNALRSVYEAELAKACSANDAEERAKTAARTQHAYELARAERDVLVAEQRVVLAKPNEKEAAQKELKSAQDRLDKTSNSQPRPSYTSLRASIKALEGPDETEASRFRPYPDTSTGRRLALARWMVDARNPLTARVAVNHLWLRHFGQPLVETVSDFGNQSEAPAQHALLDWLASELIERDWSMKHLHRLMVTSQAYRLSSSTLNADPATRAADPNNQFYWRRQPVRMESQVIRDSLLQLAGALDPAMGGPTIDPKKGGFRRSLYFTHSRDDQEEFLGMFDDADILRCYRRTESVVPQQALTLANSRLALSMSRRITERLQNGKPDDDQFIIAAFEHVLAMPPTQEELAACRDALQETRTLLAGHQQPGIRARQDLVHALINHNDFITIR